LGTDDAGAAIADIGIGQALGIEDGDAGVGMTFRQLRAVIRIGEPDRAVLVGRDVVGRVQRLTVVIVGDHGHGAVMLPTDHPAQEMLGGDLAALEVERVAVGIERLAAEFGDLAGFPNVAILDVLGDIAEHDILTLFAPGRSFRPFKTGLHPLDGAVADETVIGGGIQDQDIGVGIDIGRRVMAVCAAIEDGGQGRQLRLGALRKSQGGRGYGGARQHAAAGQIESHGKASQLFCSLSEGELGLAALSMPQTVFSQVRLPLAQARGVRRSNRSSHDAAASDGSI